MSVISSLSRNKNLPFWLFTIAVIFVLIFSQLIQDGVFTDGMLYISVSKNLAEGRGSFWSPHFSPTLFPVFSEQPPLYFGLLALFYKTFGTSMYVERLFCFLCLLFTLLYIHKLWKTLLHTDNAASQYGWLPVLFYTTIPICFWAYSNHVEETVMTLFVVMAVFYSSKALYLCEKPILYLFVAGICIFLASLTKGIQGLFPITVVFFYWLLNQKTFSFKQTFFYSLILIATPALIYTLLILYNHHIYEALQHYLQNRLGKTFYTQMHSTTNNRFEILIRLLTELIPMYVLMLLIFMAGKKNAAAHKLINNNYKTALWLLLIGFSGSLPLMVTLEQRGFYLVTSLPFFALAGAIMVIEHAKHLIEKTSNKQKTYSAATIIAALLLTFSVAFTISKTGATKRDNALLNDVYAIGKIVPRGRMLALPDEMAYDYSLRQYLIRYFYIGADNLGYRYDYFVIRKNLPKTLVPKEYKHYPLQTQEVDLYKLVK